MSAVRMIIVLIVVGVVSISALIYLNTNRSVREVHITIVGDEIDYYDPSNITLRRGETVTLVILNTDNTAHGFSIDALGINAGTIAPGTTARITFTPMVDGRFQFYSPIESGNETSVQNLRGYITVTG